MIKRIVIKEILLGLTILLGGFFAFKALQVDVKVKWIVFSVMFTSLFIGGTYILKIARDRLQSLIGIIFAGITLINQIIFLILLFIFLEPQKPEHRILAFTGVIVYLVYLGIDTFWKLKLLFPPNKSAGNNTIK